MVGRFFGSFGFVHGETPLGGDTRLLLRTKFQSACSLRTASEASARKESIGSIARCAAWDLGRGVIIGDPPAIKEQGRTNIANRHRPVRNLDPGDAWLN